MLEFTEAYIRPFKWAMNAYNYSLGLATPTTTVTVSDLTATDLKGDLLPVGLIEVAADWNNLTTNYLAFLAGLYDSIDQAYSYYNSLQTILSSRIAESEHRAVELANGLKNLRSVMKMDSTTSIFIRGGDTSWVETGADYYIETPMLERVSNESAFRLKDTGFFSSIRSTAGFSGVATIDKSLGKLIETGTLGNISDGSRNTFWVGTTYAPAPMRADQNDVSWLPVEYRHGAAFMLTYHLDRPTYVSQVYIDPISTEPFDLVAISWDVATQTDALATKTLSDWSLVGSSFVGAFGTNGGSGALVTAPSGYISYMFGLASVVSGVELAGSRTTLFYNMKGMGDLYSGARVVWYNASGSILTYDQQDRYPTAFYSPQRLTSIIPTGAVTGRIDLGLFRNTTGPASGYFESPIFYIGEQRWNCGVSISAPTTVPLPYPVLGQRFSFVFAQRNPRREVLAKETADEVLTPISENKNVDSNLQKSTQLLADELSYAGPGNTVFSYKVGIKELDLRYREFIPRGSLVSLPLKANKEIRKLWVTAELDRWYDAGVKFYVYPFEQMNKQDVVLTELEPWRVFDVDSYMQWGDSPRETGDVLNIVTPEELDAGWTSSTGTNIVIPVKPMVETFQGTSRDGKLTLSNYPHLRRVKVNSIKEWLKVYGIWSLDFDPNAATLYGLPDSATKELIRSGNIAGSSFDTSEFNSFDGYLPLKVTVRTSKWTAFPDTFGKPSENRVRSIQKETLGSVTKNTVVTSTSSDEMDFNSWLSATTVDEVLEKTSNKAIRDAIFQLTGSHKLDDGHSASAIHKMAESAVRGSKGHPAGTESLMKVLQDQLKRKRSGNISSLIAYKKLQKVYDDLKQLKLLTLNSSQTVTETSSVSQDGVYKTLFGPIVSGRSGSMIRVYWLDPASGLYIPINSNNVEVDAYNQIVTVHGTPPTSAYTSVAADYKYLLKSGVEDYFSEVITAATVPSTGVESFAGFIRESSRSLPITRNVTDYLNGKIPVLTPPVFDRMSKDYYPVIEYYMSDEGTIVFSRDFFLYGDQPADIEVSYETLAVTPRVVVDVTRLDGPTKSPNIYSISLNVREGSSAPTREVS